MKLKKLISIVSALALALTTLSITAFADVASTDVAKIGNTGYATIEGAVDAANNGDLIEIVSPLENGAVEFPTTLKIADNVTIKGIASGNEKTVVHTLGTIDKSTNGLTIKNIEFSQTSETFKVYGKNITLENCDFNANTLTYTDMYKNGLYPNIFSGYARITGIGDADSRAENITFKNCKFSGKAAGSGELPNALLIGKTFVNNLTIDGCEFADAFGAIYYSEVSGNYNINDTTINVYCYTTHAGGDTDCTFVAKNSTFNGWTSYNNISDNGSVFEFDNCKFGKYNGYAVIAAYENTLFNGCDFSTDVSIYTQTLDTPFTYEFNDCKVDGATATESKLDSTVFNADKDYKKQGALFNLVKEDGKYVSGSVCAPESILSTISSNIVDGKSLLAIDGLDGWYKIGSPVAKIGDTSYATAEEALEAAGTTSTVTISEISTMESAKKYAGATVELSANAKLIAPDILLKADETVAGKYTIVEKTDGKGTYIKQHTTSDYDQVELREKVASTASTSDSKKFEVNYKIHMTDAKNNTQDNTLTITDLPQCDILRLGIVITNIPETYSVVVTQIQ